MPRKSDSTKARIREGVTESRFSVILNIKLVQKMKLIAIYEDVTEKDLYHRMMKDFIEKYKEVHYPDYLRED